MDTKYCNVCKKDVKPVRGKCPECGMKFNIKLKEDAEPIIIHRVRRKKEEEKNILFVSSVSRLLVSIIIFGSFALLLVRFDFVIFLLMLVIAFLLYAVTTLCEKIYEIENELRKIKNKVKKTQKTKKSSSK